MPQAFDAYHLWLGIPPHEQPPNHYRLLGIALFESNADVIATAADRQMAHLRTFQSGKRSALSQRLLNEVAAAKILLLSPAKKADYDEQLHSSSLTRRVSMAGKEAAPGADEGSPWEDIVGAARAVPVRRAVGKRRTNSGAFFVAALAGAAVLCALAAWFAPWREGETEEPAAPSANGAAVSKSGNAALISPHPGPPGPLPKGEGDHFRTALAGSDNPNPPTVPATALAPSAPEGPALAKAADGTALTRPVFEKPSESVEKAAASPEKPAMPSFDFSGETGGRSPNAGETPALQQAKRRLPVPDDAAQEKIAAQLARDYAPSRARTPAEKIKLAYRILQAAKASKEPSERYVLLQQGRELANQASDAALALQAIEMTGEFEIDVVAEKGRTMLAWADKPKNEEQIGAFFSAAQGVIAEALSAGRHDLASDLSQAVYRVCQRSKEFRKQAFDQQERVQAFCRRQAELQAAEAKLRASPDDAEAHLALGRHYCLDDDWPSGLAHLAKGSDREVQQLAERDLASPAAPAEQIELADAWWTLGKARQGDDRDMLLLRAGHWYDLARVKLTSGLERLKAEKRLEELAEIRQRRAAGGRLLRPDKDAPRDLWNGVF